MTRGRWIHLCGASLALAALACDTAAPAPAAGARCGGSAPYCASGLACVDGLCRPLPPAPNPLARPDTDLPDTYADTDLPDTAADTDLPDTTADTPPLVERSLLGRLDPDTLAETRLSLAVGQAAALELTLPFEARAESLQLLIFRQGPSCGLFRPLLWFPLSDTTFATFPDLIGTAQPLGTTGDGATLAELPLPAHPSLPATTYRVGVRYEGPCTGSARPPFIALDSAGDPTGAFVWADTWVPGTDLNLPGRWAIALELARP